MNYNTNGNETKSRRTNCRRAAQSKRLIVISALVSLAFAAAVQATTNWTQKQKLVDAAGVAPELFGASIFVDGNTAIVGAIMNECALIYKWDGSSFIQQQKIVSSDGYKYVFFGTSVSLSGDWAIVGAPSSYGKGTVYIFKWNGASWVQQQRLLASDGVSGDDFGCSVTISGDYAIIGAQGDDSSKGAAYVFKWNGASWVQQQKLTASDGAAGDNFGHSVYVRGDMVIISAWYDDALRGSAYIFTRSGEVWNQQQKLTGSDSVPGDKFAYSVSTDGSRIIFGAYSKNDSKGAAYIFVQDGNNWTQQQKLVASDPVINDDFGNSVSISGDYAIIGAYGVDVFTGAVYMFKWNGASWIEEVKLAASDGADNDSFGVSVFISGSLAIAGADYNAGAKGAAYVFKFCSGADLTGDCKTDFNDYAILANWWLERSCGEAGGWCGGSDFDKSGTVDSLDAIEIQQHWLDEI